MCIYIFNLCDKTCFMCVIGSLERRKGTRMRDSLMDNVDKFLSYIIKCK